MALSISELNTVSKKYFDKVITQQVYEDDPFFAKLKKDNKIRISGGTKIQWPIRHAELNQAQATGPRKKVEFQSKETRTGAELDWAYYDGNTMIHWDEQAKNSGAGQIIDLVKDKSEEMKDDFSNKLYTDLYATSQGTNAFVPLSSIIDSGTTYAGIAVSDAAVWASTEDSSETVLTLYGEDSISEAINATTFGKDHPTHIITSRDLASKFESLLVDKVRYEDKEMANLGFDNFTFKKIPVIASAYITSTYLYGIDMKQFGLAMHKDYDMKVSDWFELPQAGYPNAKAKYICAQLNIMCRMRQTSFKFTALDYTL
jgi:hypothetical protein